LNKEPTNIPFFERPDLSPYLVHLTKSTSSPKRSALNNLINMLKCGEIFGSGKSGFIKGPNEATCFTDIPLSSLKFLLNVKNTNPENPRYQPYGILVSKKFAYRKGARPVIYLSDAELALLSINQQEIWRVVRFEGVDDADVNWTHEREWRRKGNFPLPTNPYAVLVKTVAEARKLREKIVSSPKDFASLPSSIIPLEVLCQGLPYIFKK
jgi:hypothetical protein